jgi:hypothetical protein
MERGLTIAFHPGAMVWHYRRFTLQAYLKQQIGYGKAEGLLLGQHSHRFGHFGGARWRGTVYQPALLQLTRQSGRIYSGSFGHAPFQIIYTGPLSDYFQLASSFPWLLVGLALVVNISWSAVLGWVGIGMLGLTLLLPLRQIYLIRLPAKYDSAKARLLLWFLLVAQPLVRNTSRFYWGLLSGGAPSGPMFNARPSRFARLGFPKRVAELNFWSTEGKDREPLLTAMGQGFTAQKLTFQADDGWKNWDMEVQPHALWAVRLTTVTEYHAKGATLTRVRLATRATILNLLINSGLIILVLTIIFSAKALPALGTLAVFLGWLSLLEMQHRRTAKRIAAFAIEQAVQLGFHPTELNTRNKE